MLTRTVRKLKRIIKWIPILWHDEDWDYFFLYTILQKKLETMRDYTLQQDRNTDSKYVASRMQTAINLIEKIKTEAYIDGFLDMHESGGFNKEQLDKAIKKHDRAKALLFNFLNHNISHWWD
jgi:hypothetical protein